MLVPTGAMLRIAPLRMTKGGANASPVQGEVAGATAGSD